MYDALISRLIHRAHLICKINKDSKECISAWNHIEKVMKQPPPKKPCNQESYGDRNQLHIP